MGASTLPNRFEYTLHCSVKRRALVCAIFVLAWLLCGSNVSATSMGKNDHGFPRSGPIEPRAYPDSVSVVVPCFNCGEFVLQVLSPSLPSLNLPCCFERLNARCGRHWRASSVVLRCSMR